MQNDVSLSSLYHSRSGFSPALISYASVPISRCCFHYHHLIFPVSFLLALPSNPIRSFGQHTLASNQVLAFLTNIRRAGITTLLGFRTNGRHRRENTSPVCREVASPASTRVASRKIKIPLDRGGRHGEEFLRSLAAVELGRSDPRRIETQARGGSGEHSRRFGAGNRRGTRYARVAAAATAAAAPPSLARSSRLAVTNNTRSFGQNRCILQRRQIGLYVYE